MMAWTKIFRQSRLTMTVIASVLAFSDASVLAQSTSIRVRERGRGPTIASGQADSSANPRIPTERVGNPVLERWSLAAVKVKAPKKYVVHDLVTIIIREQRVYESEGELEVRKRFDFKATVNAFLKLDDGNLRASTFPNGQPNIDFKFLNRIKNEADKDREDRLTTRITAQILDIKPNGNLVLEAYAQIGFDNEVSTLTLSGIARSQDITPDNTVLSTQLADKAIFVTNSGAVRDGSARGWMTKLLDIAGPF